YRRMVGETGGRDVMVVRPSGDMGAAATALVRGGFGYEGQEWSAAARGYIPASLWPELKERIVADVESFNIGPTDDFSNFINAVIDEKSFDKLAKYIDQAKADAEAEIIVGGTYDKSEGYFIHPTV